MPTVRDIIGKWPSASEFARDLGLKREGHGVMMRMRGRIPASYWQRVVSAAEDRGIEGVTYEALAAAHAVPQPEAAA